MGVQVRPQPRSNQGYSAWKVRESHFLARMGHGRAISHPAGYLGPSSSPLSLLYEGVFPSLLVTVHGSWADYCGLVERVRRNIGGCEPAIFVVHISPGDSADQLLSSSDDFGDDGPITCR
jgi:hypothetical protein